MITRWLITTAVVHVFGGVVIALCTMGVTDAVPAGIFLALFGCFYLLIEVPLIFTALYWFGSADSAVKRYIRSGVVIILSVAVSYFLCISVGGERPPDYMLGFTIAGLSAGILVSLAGIDLSKNVAEQVAASDR